MTRARHLILPLVLLGQAACSQHSADPPPPGSKEGTARAQEKSSPKPEGSDHKDVSDHKDESEHEELPSRVRLAAKVAAAAGVKTAPVRTEALPDTVNLTGEIVADPDRSAKVTTRVAGRIVDVRFKEGDRVKAGALLAVIESPELARARAAYTAATARARTVRLNAERLKSVAQRGLASGQEVSASEAEALAMEAEARAARQTLAAFGPDAAENGSDAARLTIRAPVSGSVLSRDAIRGQTVAADHVLVTLAELDKAYFVARLFEKDLSRVAPGAAAEVRLNAYPKEVFQGVVETVGKQLDATARTVTARVALSNRADLLKVGLFGNALVVVKDSAQRTQRIVVPFSAITQIAGKDVVFVRQPDEDFEVHPVTLGRSAGGKAEIITGLRAGEQVVTEGVFTLKSAVLKSTFGEEE